MVVELQLGAAAARLEGPTTRILAGRDPQACGLAFADATMSRRHAEIFVEQGQVFVRDLGSSNGTWVDGAPVGAAPVALRPGQRVFLGHVPLGVRWGGDAGHATVLSAQVPAELVAQMAARQAQHVAAAAAPARPSASAPTPAAYAYRKQGANSNGTLLLALRQDTFFNSGTVEGFCEFTSLDNQSVAAITVELVEHHRRGPKEGHVWDRFVVRQGPWRAEHGDVLPLPFQLRVPPGTSMSGRDVSWTLRGLVDINWAVDIEADLPITMRNVDLERLRDGLGALDYRVVELESVGLGQRFEGTFAPPAHLASQLGVNKVELHVEYLGANLKLRMLVDRKGLHHDRALDQVFELERLRAASQAEVNATMKAMLEQLLPR